ncbi:MAG: hypothetical protein PHU25_14860 [Deltaproteobacteria bacterium]|nr:hypothetical protein [Deltaproteobacteria bacterium]
MAGRTEIERKIQLKLTELGDDDKRLIAEIVGLLVARRSPARPSLDDSDREWTAMSLEGLLRDQDHPDEVDYSLSDLPHAAEP